MSGSGDGRQKIGRLFHFAILELCSGHENATKARGAINSHGNGKRNWEGKVV
jgi:hypothetical protein